MGLLPRPGVEKAHVVRHPFPLVIPTTLEMRVDRQQRAEFSQTVAWRRGGGFVGWCGTFSWAVNGLRRGGVE